LSTEADRPEIPVNFIILLATSLLCCSSSTDFWRISSNGGGLKTALSVLKYKSQDMTIEMKGRSAKVSGHEIE